MTFVVDFTVVVFDEQFDANDLVQFSDRLKESLDAAGKEFFTNITIICLCVIADRAERPLKYFTYHNGG